MKEISVRSHFTYVQSLNLIIYCLCEKSSRFSKKKRRDCGNKEEEGAERFNGLVFLPTRRD
jgi:hypothetical protein